MFSSSVSSLLYEYVYFRMDLMPAGGEGDVEKIDTLVKQMVNGAVSKRTPNQLLVTLPLTETPSFSRMLG